MGAKLREVIEGIQATPEVIIAEVIRLEPEYTVETLQEYAESYLVPVQDLTLTFHEEDGLPVFTQCASGGGESREYKEAMRRAFCRLVIDGMHREKMEVSMIVC